MPTPEEIEALILDAQSITGPCQRYENGSLRTYYAGYNLTELAKRISATYDAIPEREREIERLRLLINTDITELSDERDGLRAHVAELEEALDVARICLKNRDRSELEEKAYFGICAVLAAKPTSEA